MTKPQANRIYWPVWNTAFATNWKRVNNTVIRLDGVQGEMIDRVERIANELAERRGGTLSADDVRHACHVIAVGQDKSHHHLNNAEVDRVCALFRLLREPESLEHILDWQNPNRDARRRQIFGLERCGLKEGQLRAWCAHFNAGEYEWRTLPDHKFRQFAGYVWRRVKSQKGARS